MDYINLALFVLAPIAALAFCIEYAWSDWLERIKPKTGTYGQPLGTTPNGFMKSYKQIETETPIVEKFNQDMEIFNAHKRRFDKFKPYIKRIRLYSGVLTFLFGCLKLAALKV